MDLTAFKKTALWEDDIPFGWHGIDQHLIMRMAEIDPTLRGIRAPEKRGALRLSVDRDNANVGLHRQEIETWSIAKCQTCDGPGPLMVSSTGFMPRCAPRMPAPRHRTASRSSMRSLSIPMTD